MGHYEEIKLKRVNRSLKLVGNQYRTHHSSQIVSGKESKQKGNQGLMRFLTYLNLSTYQTVMRMNLVQFNELNSTRQN